MVSRSSLSVRSVLAAAGVVAVVAGSASAQRAVGSASDRLEQAATMLTEGRVVRARAMLLELTGPESIAQLSDKERTRALALARNAGKRLKELGAEEVSLQSAEEALQTDDLRTALAQAQAVIESPQATNAQVGQARQVIDQATARQATIAPRISKLLEEAVSAYEAGDLTAARENLTTVKRSGIDLAPDLASILDRYQTLVVEQEKHSGNMAHMQPGVVRRRTTPPPPAAPQPAPDAPPAAQPQPEPAFEIVNATMQPAQDAQPPAAPQPAPVDPVAQARRWEAQGILAEANFALSENRLSDAVARYQQLMDQYADQLTADERTMVQQRLGEARVRLGANPGQAVNPLQETIGNITAAQEMARREFDVDIDQARRALQRGDMTRARDLAAQARVRIASHRNIFDSTQLENFGRQVDSLLAEIDSAEDAARQARIAEEERRNREGAQQASAERLASKNRSINEAIDRVRALQSELKYEEALQIVESQILFQDPVNPTGLLLKEMLQDTIVYRRASSLNRQRYRSYAEHALDNIEAQIAPPNILDYPADWPAISNNRGAPPAFAEAEENRRALAVLQNKRIPVDFDETPLENAIQFIAAVTQLNVDVDWQALSNDGVDRQDTITLKLSNVPVETVLNRIVEKVSPDSFSGAAWNIVDGVLTISNRAAINKQKAIVLYDIRDLIVEVPDYTNSYELDLQQALQQAGQGGGGGGGGQSPFQQNNENEQERRTLEERTNDIIEILTTNVDSEGWRQNGGDVGDIQQLGGLLIITNTPANHRAINGLLAKLREFRAMQINVETRFLLVSQDFFEQIGIDLDVYLNANSNVVRAARATRPGTLPSELFDPNSGAYSRRFPTFGPGANANLTGLPSPWSPIGSRANSLGLAESLISTDISGEILNQGPAMGIAGQFLDDIQVDFLIKATQADRRTITLNAPRLTFTNGQISNIVVATQIAYVADLEPETSESAAAFDPVPGRLVEGVTMLVDGTISADRRYVTLNIDAGVSRVERIENQPVTAIAGGQLVNSASVQSFIQLPVVTVTRVQTTVTVPDQGTILLGGQRLTTEAEVETGVPVLSKIPILNRFFTNRVLSKEDQTLLILLKPTVLIQNEEEEKAFPGIEQSLRIPLGG